MTDDIRKILENVQNGSLSVDDALLSLKKEPFEDIGYAKVDMHRKIRQGAAEVIYGAGKTPEQIIGIVKTMQTAGQETTFMKFDRRRPSWFNSSSVKGECQKAGSCFPEAAFNFWESSSARASRPVAYPSSQTTMGTRLWSSSGRPK